MHNKELTEDKKQITPQEALVGFLGLLCTVSRPGVSEFCTPGHKAGRGFGAMMQPVRVEPVITLGGGVSDDGIH